MGFKDLSEFQKKALKNKAFFVIIEKVIKDGKV